MRFVRPITTILGAILLVALVSTPAMAGGPTRITVTGPGISSPIVIKNGTPEFTVLSNVAYDAGLEVGVAAQPLPDAPASLGPRYILAVDYHDKPAYVYELYPHSTDGPHIYLGFDQPKSKLGPAGQIGWYRTSRARVTEALAILRIASAGAAQPAATVPETVTKPATTTEPGRLSVALPAGLAAVAVFGVGWALLRRRVRR